MRDRVSRTKRQRTLGHPYITYSQPSAHTPRALAQELWKISLMKAAFFQFRQTEGHTHTVSSAESPPGRSPSRFPDPTAPMACWNDDKDIASMPHSWRTQMLSTMAASKSAVILTETEQSNCPGAIVACNAAWNKLCGYSP